MKQYSWPGNVRELENLVQRLSALYPQERITDELVEGELAAARPAETVHASGMVSGEQLQASVSAFTAQLLEENLSDEPIENLYSTVLKEIEEPLINVALRATRGNQIQAAKVLGLNRKPPYARRFVNLIWKSCAVSDRVSILLLLRNNCCIIATLLPTLF